MRPRTIRVCLIVLEALVGLNAVLAGCQILTGGWNLPAGWLEHTPFDSWALPGLALLLLPGLGELLAAASTVGRLPYYRRLSMFAGAGLAAWVLVQLAWMRVVQPVMHPLVFGVGVLITVLAWELGRIEPVDQPPPHATRDETTPTPDRTVRSRR
jgi:hypothetical protein